jgi:hypothetical protein
MLGVVPNPQELIPLGAAQNPQSAIVIILSIKTVKNCARKISHVWVKNNIRKAGL